MCAKNKTDLLSANSGQEQDELLKLILDNSPFPTAVVDTKDEKIFYWSRSAKDLFGHTPDTTEEWYQLAYPDAAYRKDVIKRWKPFIEEAHKSNKIINTGEYNITCQDGSVKTCELYAQIIPGYLLVTLNDVSSRKSTEEALRQSKDTFYALFDHNPLPTYIWDRVDEDFILQRYNQTAHDITSGKVGDIVGIKASDMYKNDPDIISYFNEAFSKRTTVSKEIDYVYKTTGEHRYLSCKFSFVHPNSLMVITEDTTEKRQYEDKLIAANQQLRAANQQLGANEQELRAANQQLSASEQQLRAANQQLSASEQQLKKREKLLQTAGKIARLGGWELDVIKQKVTWTEETYRIHEVPMDHEPELEEAINFFHPDDRPILECAIKNAMEKGEPYDLTLRFITAKGKHLYTHTICEPIVKKGKVVRLFGFFQDVTAMKKAEEEIKKQEMLLRSSVESPVDMIILSLDRDYRYLYFNKTHLHVMEAAYGKTPEVGKCIFDYMTNKKDIQKIKQGYDKGLKGESLVFTESYGSKQIRDYRIHINPIYNDDQKVIGITSFASDISERKAMEKKLIESEKLLKRTQEIAELGGWEYDVETKKISWTDQVYQIYGVDKDFEPTDVDKVSKFFHPDDRQQLLNAFSEAIKGNAYDLELRFINAQGKELWVRTIGQPVKEKGKVVKIRGNFADITAKKRFENDLRESENLYRALFKQSPQGIYTHGLDGRIIQANHVACKQLGYSEEEMKTMTVFDFHPGSESSINLPKAEIIKQWKSWEDNDVHTISAEHIRKDGTIFEVEISSSKVKIGGKDQILALVQDITERKEAEDKLKESEEKFRDLVEKSLQGMVIAQNDPLRLSFASKPMEAITGYTAEELMSLTPEGSQALIHPDDRERFFGNFMKRLNKEDVPSHLEYRIMHKNGSIRWVELFSSRVIYKGEPAIQAVFIDISDRKKAEDLLVNSEKRLKEAEHIGRIGHVEWMVAEQRFYWSDEIFNIYECDPEKGVPGYDEIMKLHVPEDAKRLESAVLAALESGQEYDLDLKAITPSGKVKVLHIIGKPQQDNDGNIISIKGTVQDISGRKKIEDDLIEARLKAEESDRLKSAFLANMSHEIRTPMNGILGFTSLLENPGLSEEQRDKYLHIIKQSGDRMLSTVNDLINISKIETGQEELKPIACNPCDLLKNQIEFFKHSAEEKGLTLSLEQQCSHRDQKIMIDAGKFDSIVGNLIRNAIKFTDSGSITVTCNKHDERFILKVCDTGSGIPKDRQEAIFDRFVQADINNNKAYQGSGLGLSIVKAYVDMMKGKISLNSEPGKGSCFTVELPITVLKEKMHQYIPVEEGLKEIKLNKVLIAEDDEISMQHLKISLEGHATDILHATNGKDAVDFVKANKDIDLVLMDIKMPDMDGYEATRRIREFDPDILIIAQTAYALPEDEQKALEAGCNAYISKPIDINRLFAMVSKLRDST